VSEQAICFKKVSTKASFSQVLLCTSKHLFGCFLLWVMFCGVGSVGGCLGGRGGWRWWLVGVVSANGLWEWLWLAMIMVVGSFLIEFYFAFLHCCFKGFLHMLAMHMLILKDYFKWHCLLLLLTSLVFNVSYFVQCVNMKRAQ